MAHKNKYTIIEFLAVSISDFNIHEDKVVNNSVDQNTDSQLLPLEEKGSLTSTSEGRELKLHVLHNVLEHSLNPLEWVTFPGFPTCFDRSDVWNFFPTVASYCANIPDARKLCTVKHRLLFPRLCNRCLDTPEDFENNDEV